MSAAIQSIQDEIVEDFSLFETANDKYQYIIELGNQLKPLADEYKTEQYIIKGCQSKVWLHAQQDGDKVVFTADSDSVLVKGLISLLVKVLSNQVAKDIVTAELDFINQIGLQSMLSMNRSNGLASMLKQMKMYAVALQK